MNTLFAQVPRELGGTDAIVSPWPPGTAIPANRKTSRRLHQPYSRWMEAAKEGGAILDAAYRLRDTLDRANPGHAIQLFCTASGGD
jgi:hypothetical protein